MNSISSDSGQILGGEKDKSNDDDNLLVSLRKQSLTLVQMTRICRTLRCGFASV